MGPGGRERTMNDRDALCRDCGDEADSDRPQVNEMVAFKGDFNEPECDECGEPILTGGAHPPHPWIEAAARAVTLAVTMAVVASVAVYTADLLWVAGSAFVVAGVVLVIDHVANNRGKDE